MSFRVVGLGEVLWDLLPTGKKLGGAPANFAYHAAALGADARVISRVGDDALGREILARLSEIGLPIDGVSTDFAHPTGTVSVEVARDGQPHYTIHEDVAWDHLVADATAMATVAEADAICFGSLAQRCADSRQSIHALLTATPRKAWRIFDVNLRQNFYSREILEGSLALANVLKLNDAELPVLARLLDVTAAEEQASLNQIAERFGLRLVVYTLGARGCVLFDGTRWTKHVAKKVAVQDTIGAGDSLTAAVTMGLLRQWDLATIGERASAIAAYVCSCEGATPPLPDDLRALYSSGSATDRRAGIR